MTTPKPAAGSPMDRVRTGYNAASDRYDDPVLSFWSRIGRATIERMNLRVGDHVLDVCAGSGASTIPAAEMVGPTGSVLAVDIAEELLARCEQKAAERGLANVRCRVADMGSLSDAVSSFDAVVCVFGIFFAEQMHEQLAMLASLLRPGGAIAITTWGPRMFEPGTSLFWDAVGRVRPELKSAFSPWERIETPETLQAIFDQAKVPDVSITAEASTQPIYSPEDFWTIAMGSGFRWTIDRLTPDEQKQVHDEVVLRLAELHPRGVETNVIYAVARQAATPRAHESQGR